MRVPLRTLESGCMQSPIDPSAVTGQAPDTQVLQSTQYSSELRGGVTGAALTLGILLPLAQLSFAALGHEALPHAIRAAFVAAIVGNVVCVLAGSGVIGNAIPRTSTSLIFAGLVASLAAAGLDLTNVLTLTALCVLVSGLLQVVFALVGMGSLVRYVPLPAVSGFVNGIAILILVAQVAPLSGLSGRGASIVGVLHQMQPGAMLLGLGTAATMWLVARKFPKWPAALVALAAGTLVYALVTKGWPDVQWGPLFGAPDSGLPWPDAWQSWLEPSVLALIARHLPQLLSASLVIALIGSLDALLAAAATEHATGLPYSPNRLLMGMGLANVASSAFGGLPVVYSNSVVQGMHASGARHGSSTLVSAALLLLLLMFGAPLLGAIPLTVSAGVMVVIAVNLFDRWSPGLVRQLIRGRGTPEVRSSVAIVAIVCVTTIVFGFVISIAVGVALSLVMFIAAMNRSLVRGATTAAARPSRRIYPADQAAAIRASGARVKVVTLEGAIFFGTAETLRREVTAIADGATFVILDLASVRSIDASGAIVLDRLDRQLTDAGTRLLLAGVVEGGHHAQALQAFDREAVTKEENRFDDVDQALEHTEWTALMQAGLARSDLEVALETLPLMEGLSASQRKELARSMKRRQFAAGEIMFRRGDVGDEMFALTRGSVTLVEGLGDDGVEGRRIVSFRSGVVFGELALLDGGARTATAIVEADSVGYSLSRTDLERLRGQAPELAAQILLNIARQIAARLRFGTMVLWRSDAGL